MQRLQPEALCNSTLLCWPLEWRRRKRSTREGDATVLPSQQLHGNVWCA